MTLGLPIVLSAPSGGGKSTIANELLMSCSHVVRSISCTTRAPRRGEEPGRDYFFTSREEFQKKIAANQFLEWAEVHGHFYGTPRNAFEENIQKGISVLLVIDPQGAVSVRQLFPEGIFIFLVPPTWDDLLARLTKRATDDESVKKLRIENAKKELSYLPTYDYLVVNDALDVAVADIQAILRAEERRMKRVDFKNIPILAHDHLV